MMMDSVQDGELDLDYYAWIIEDTESIDFCLNDSPRRLSQFQWTKRYVCRRRINSYTSQLLNYKDQSNTYNLTESLMFLAHFVGDIHQPLHAGFEADEGGDTIIVHWYQRNSNLHHIHHFQLILRGDLHFITGRFGEMRAEYHPISAEYHPICEFSDIFDIEHFKRVLADDVRVVSSLPSTHPMSRPVEEKRTPLHVSPRWNCSRYLRRLNKEGVLLLRGLDYRLSKDLPPDLQKLRCKLCTTIQL